jgi:hypothetical protein
MNLNESVALQVLTRRFAQIDAKHGNLPEEKKLAVLASEREEMIGSAAILLAIASEIAILSTPGSTRQRAAAAAQRAAAVALTGDGSIASPLKAGAHIDRLEQRIVDRPVILDVNAAAAERDATQRKAIEAATALAVARTGWPNPGENDPGVIAALAAVRAADEAARAAAERFNDAMQNRR